MWEYMAFEEYHLILNMEWKKITGPSVVMVLFHQYEIGKSITSSRIWSEVGLGYLV